MNTARLRRETNPALRGPSINPYQRKIATLEEKLVRKNEVLSELMEGTLAIGYGTCRCLRAWERTLGTLELRVRPESPHPGLPVCLPFSRRSIEHQIAASGRRWHFPSGVTMAGSRLRLSRNNLSLPIIGAREFPASRKAEPRHFRARFLLG